jgi:hypothetical protein
MQVESGAAGLAATQQAGEISAFKGVSQSIDSGCCSLGVTPESERPDAGVDQQAHG